ncbi:RAN GTPase-activating protein 1 [Diplonema papillatum]|nr:RAN GTPase-activating protein 1 [Diplonema papillatum]
MLSLIEVAEYREPTATPFHVASDAEGCLDRVLAALAALRENACDTISLDGGVMGYLDACDARQLAEGIQANTSVTSLDLSLNRINDSALTVLAGELRQNPRIQSLHLDNNNLTATGVSSLCECLQSNTTLTKLDLSSNAFGDDAAAPLARYLNPAQISRDGTRVASGPSLVVLHLRCNGITDAGGTELLGALKSNATLQVLHLSGNKLTNASVPTLCDFFAKATPLQELNLANNEFTPEGVEEVSRFVSGAHTSLVHLGLSTNGKRYKSASLTAALRRNRDVLLQELALNDDVVAYVDEQFSEERRALIEEISLLKKQLAAKEADGKGAEPTSQS